MNAIAESPAWCDDRPADGDGKALRQALGSFATGVTVITARSPAGESVGITASSFNTVSLDPPLVLWSLSSQSPHLVTFSEGSHFAVNVLAADQEDLCSRFGRPQKDKFAGLAFDFGAGGAPLLPGVVAQFECSREAVYPGGDHVILLGRILRYRWSERLPLTFCQGRLAPARASERILIL